ncbi:hypothetical protein K443DRAFT_474541 [Laccaria amethystina LaAM-08-1]|uniref:MYND-type domain-containing protein n=1 Tax=Laccaria amethystina LaAM-08-1 TaxID=1095629 RepID=A0A0C9WHS3_9AGAR|nr:hypothetical protein K443DRAFT_474541 [Laccaria amethystina LaAM-08-1]
MLALRLRENIIALYCSKACRKVDWKNHNSFCKPAAPSSVIDTGASHRSGEAVPQWCTS